VQAFTQFGADLRIRVQALSSLDRTLAFQAKCPGSNPGACIYPKDIVEETKENENTSGAVG
jgi:hypothetical protein